MDGLPIIIARLEREHPDTLARIKRVLAMAHTAEPEVAGDIEALFLFALQSYDEADMRLWALRDLITKREKFNAESKPDYYWALKHNAADMVRRIHAWAEIGDGKIEIPFTDKPHE